MRSYSRLNQLLPKTARLVQAASEVKYEILESELQALLVEAELIRLHQPHYNILLKDDKTPLYIVITKEDFPKVVSVRKSDLNQPTLKKKRIFGPFPSGRQVREVLKIGRRLFPFCGANDQDKKNHKACLYSHIGLCPGACTGAITKDEYAKNINQLEKFLIGKHTEIIKDFSAQIEAYASVQDFEAAANLKRKVEAITYVNAHYKNRLDDQILPQLTEDIQAERLIELTRVLKSLNVRVTSLDRIETYDVSNLQGTSPTVSMVVAIQGNPDHSEYKHFTIKTLKSPNDVGMLKEAVTRRQNHPEWGIPNLIVVDGGRPQVKAVLSIIQWSVPVVGLAKDPDRLVVVTSKDPFIVHEYRLEPGKPGAGLLIHLRDEAHRFSRRLHHKHHLNALLES